MRRLSSCLRGVPPTVGPGSVTTAEAIEEDLDWRTDKRFSKMMRIKNAQGNPQEKRLYYIGALAQAMGKEPVTIRRYIRLGVIPDSTYRTRPIEGTLNDSGRRLWTEEQIELLVQIAREEGMMEEKRKQVIPQRFSGRVQSVWKERGW